MKNQEISSNSPTVGMWLSTGLERLTIIAPAFLSDGIRTQQTGLEISGLATSELDGLTFLQLTIMDFFARIKKPSGRKNENRTVKLPNQTRHDENAAIAVGTWKKRNKNKKTR